jgi:hypothetical protein
MLKFWKADKFIILKSESIYSKYTKNKNKPAKFGWGQSNVGTTKMTNVTKSKLFCIYLTQPSSLKLIKKYIKTWNMTKTNCITVRTDVRYIRLAWYFLYLVFLKGFNPHRLLWGVLDTILCDLWLRTFEYSGFMTNKDDHHAWMQVTHQ